MSNSILGERIAAIKEANGQPLKELTVLSAQNDPYRLDTPAKHRDAQWLKDALSTLDINPSRIHLRGLHYLLVGRAYLPDWKDGGIYKNTDENWGWLSSKVVKAARWLGYLSWDMFEDQRNSEPEIYRQENESPMIHISTASVKIELPQELDPEPFVWGDFYRQPYQFVIIAEKAGVGDVLRPLAMKTGGELILPTGEISDTLIYQMMLRAEQDGRPLVVFSLGDFDPAGHQMAVSIARKVQAMADSVVSVDAQVFAPALELHQCQSWDLPSTPLKPTEKRADGWLERWGWEQTELDAAVALAPDQLRESVWQAMQPVWDADLSTKNNDARNEACEEAGKKLAEYIDDEELEAIREQMEEKLAGLSEQVDQVNNALNIEVPWLPNPDQELGEAEGSDDWLQATGHWQESTQRMRRRKRYE